MNEDLAKHDTLLELVSAWQQSEADIRQAHALLKASETRLKTTFARSKAGNCRFDVLGYHRNRELTQLDKMLLELKRDAWKVLVERMEIRSRLSVARAKELDEKLENGDLPDITEENILGMMEAAYSNIQNYMKEAVVEVFEFLRPHPSQWGKNYKTNTQFELGKRVVLSYMVEQKWNGGGFRVDYHRAAQLHALDNVFHILDGQRTFKTYSGPLHDAVEAVDAGGYGETDYFKFRCCKNRSLHLEFKRLDLVKRLNEVAGGKTIKPENAA